MYKRKVYRLKGLRSVKHRQSREYSLHMGGKLLLELAVADNGGGGGGGGPGARDGILGGGGGGGGAGADGDFGGGGGGAGTGAEVTGTWTTLVGGEGGAGAEVTGIWTTLGGSCFDDGDAMVVVTDVFFFTFSGTCATATGTTLLLICNGPW